MNSTATPHPPALPGRTLAEPLAGPLAERAPRERDLARDLEACRAIARALAQAPDHAYDAITGAARELCGAGTVGISLLTERDGARVVRRHGVAGALAGRLPEYAPLDCVPCREVIASGGVRLFREPMSRFADPDAGPPPLPVPEALIVPIRSRDATVGTLWAMAHDAGARFDAGDAGLLAMLADFATIAYERLQADASRAAAEAGGRTLDAVLDNTTAALFLMDARQQCVYMNAAAERLTGYALAEARDRPLHDVVHHTRPDGTPYPLQDCPIDRAFPQNLREQGQEVFVHRDGSFYPVAFVASPIRDAASRTVGTVVEVRDLRPERAAETRVRLALRAARAGAWTWDLQTNALDWSPEIYAMYGLPPGRTPSFEDWERSVVAEDREGLRRYVDALLAGRERELRVEFRIATADGPRWLLAVGEVERDPTGRAVRVAGLNLDVTHEKTVALALASSERALREADRRKDEFIATLAHELRNPLAPVRNAVRVLASPKASPDQQQWGRGVIERQVGTMARLLDDLLDAARITNGKLALRRERVELRSVLASAVETSQPLVEARGHRLRVDLPDAPIHVDADPLRLCQVVSNLLNNAAKYTPPGGRIDLIARVERDEVVIEVRDTGTGLDADERARVFDLFAQAGEARERSDGGLGIGLALVKGLVELHGGSVTATSPGRNRGSTFTVRLPHA